MISVVVAGDWTIRGPREADAGDRAVIGSIGVVGQLPNLHRFLKKHEIDFEQHTAGEFKRTLTIFGENTDKGRERFKQEIEDTHILFKDFVKRHRDIAAAAKGDCGMTLPFQPKKSTRWKSTDTSRPLRQTRRSRRLRSIVLMSSS